MKLYLSHHIYLKPEDIETLRTPDNEVLCEGIAVPVFYSNGISTEPAPELFANYVLRNMEPNVVINAPGGFIINVQGNQLKNLFNQDWGFVTTNIRSEINTIDTGLIPVYNQIVIKPLSEFEKSCVFCQVSQTVSKNGSA